MATISDSAALDLPEMEMRDGKGKCSQSLGKFVCIQGGYEVFTKLSKVDCCCFPLLDWEKDVIRTPLLELCVTVSLRPLTWGPLTPKRCPHDRALTHAHRTFPPCRCRCRVSCSGPSNSLAPPPRMWLWASQAGVPWECPQIALPSSPGSEKSSGRRGPSAETFFRCRDPSLCHTSE